MAEIKLNAAAHMSQFPPAIEKYRADWDAAVLKKLKAKLRQMGKKDGHYVEAFRRATGFNFNYVSRVAAKPCTAGSRFDQLSA